MGQQRLANIQSDDQSKRPNGQQPRQKSNNTVLNGIATRKGEAYRAQRRTSENVNSRASQHIVNIQLINQFITAMKVVNLAQLI